MNIQSGTSQDVYTPMNFGKIRAGLKTLEDATLNLGTYRRANENFGDKDYVVKCIADGNLNKERAISNFYYRTSGIYNKVCRYVAYIYRYDWMITPVVDRGLVVVPSHNEPSESSRNRYLKDFFTILKKFDDFNVKKFCGDAALKVIKNGCYYGYLTTSNNDKISIQELPPDYCRTRFSINGRPAVEFNMAFFDNFYPTTELRTKILNVFPPEFKKGYRAYKEGRLVPDFPGDTAGWYMLTPYNTIKFNINGDDTPIFIAAIPAIIDLDAAKELDQKRIAQKLLRILVQKMPLDKNGDPVFDVDEAQALHNNAVQMLCKAIGVDVLTTFADVDVADMSDKSNTSQSDDITRVKDSVFDEFGTSINNFNSTSNNALKYSSLNDASSIYNLIQQFEAFLNSLLEPYNRNAKKCYYMAEILPTTNENYQDLAKLYKDQTGSGFSKLKPAIALGQSESSVLATAYWENEVLDLIKVFVPPMTSATMNADTLTALTGNGEGASSEESSSAGRPEKPDEDKSDKTLANRESM